jgi:hypothetical protein
MDTELLNHVEYLFHIEKSPTINKVKINPMIAPKSPLIANPIMLTTIAETTDKVIFVVSSIFLSKRFTNTLNCFFISLTYQDFIHLLMLLLVTMAINKKPKSNASFPRIKKKIAPIELKIIINLNHFFPFLASSFVDLASMFPMGIPKTSTAIPIIIA